MSAKVSDKDFKRLNKWNWMVVRHSRNYYAVRKSYTKRGRVNKYMHRQILGLRNPKTMVDHRDRNGLNCQRRNLRISNPRLNAINSRKEIGITSLYRGVSKSKNKWKASIKPSAKRKVIHLGTFLSEIEAAISYNTAAKKYHGKHANLNKI